MAWNTTGRNANVQPNCDYRPTQQMLSHCSDLVGGKYKYYFRLGRLFTGWGEAGAVPIRKPGPVWSSVITRYPLATSLRASTQEKCYLPETQDLSYLCNDKPRRKANNASMPSLKCLLKAQRVEPSIEKSFLTRYIMLSTSEHTTKRGAWSGCSLMGNCEWRGLRPPRAPRDANLDDWRQVGFEI